MQDYETTVRRQFLAINLGLVQYATWSIAEIGASLGFSVGRLTGVLAGLVQVLHAKALGREATPQTFMDPCCVIARFTSGVVGVVMGVTTLTVDSAANYASGVSQGALAGSFGLVGCLVGAGVWTAKKMMSAIPQQNPA